MAKLYVKVRANSKYDKVEVSERNEVKVWVKAPPVEGKANKYLVKYLSKILKVPKSSIQLIKGETSPHKKLEVDLPEKILWERLGGCETG